ncbi:MAG: DUF6754 domain-containing protein [Myxococcota bacterium]|nr:DUF6754 domain-containing protein [Myxococcota bacterium]
MKRTPAFPILPAFPLLFASLLWALPAGAQDAPTGEAAEAAPAVDETESETAAEGEAVPAAEKVAFKEVAPTLTVIAPDNGSGLHLKLDWTITTAADNKIAVVRSAKSPNGPWTIAKTGLSPDKLTYTDKVTDDVSKNPPADHYWYRVVVLPKDFKVTKEITGDAIVAAAIRSVAGEGDTVAHWFKNIPGIWLLLALIVSVTGMIFFFTHQVRQGNEIKIRRIPGIDAIEEGIGRATEMGRPVLYVPGIDSLEDIQTIASMLILGEVSKTIAEYQTDVIVSCCVPIVREVADEVVKSGYYRAGHPDAFDPTSVRFIASDQFAFCAGTNGIMHRQKPATNIYLGRFFAESLILAETGYVNQSIQIAGTAEATQLPFFIAACDYTLIGEELFAVSAYLSQDARLVSSLKASDWVKIATVGLLVIGTVTVSLGFNFIPPLFQLAGG